MNECIFCKIINNEIPSHKIYEDENVYAFLDVNPSTKGHTLVIPKNHVKDIFEMDDDTAANIFRAVPKICKALEKAFNPIGLNIVNNNREPYQVVFHYHIHLIPRYENDGYVIKGSSPNISSEDLKGYKEVITKHL